MLASLRKLFGAKEAKSLASPTAEELALFAGIPAGPYAVSVSTALTVPAVSCAVQTISEAVASLGVTVVEIDGDRETPLPDHPVTQLLNGDVNDWLSGYELLRDLVSQALIYDRGGVAYIN